MIVFISIAWLPCFHMLEINKFTCQLFFYMWISGQQKRSFHLEVVQTTKGRKSCYTSRKKIAYHTCFRFTCKQDILQNWKQLCCRSSMTLRMNYDAKRKNYTYPWQDWGVPSIRWFFFTTESPSNQVFKAPLPPS